MKFPKIVHISGCFDISDKFLEEEMEDILEACDTQEDLEEAVKEYICNDLDYMITPSMLNVTFYD